MNGEKLKWKPKGEKVLFLLFLAIFSLQTAFAQKNWLQNSTTSSALGKDLEHIEQWRTGVKVNVYKAIREIPEKQKKELIQRAEKALSFDWPNLPAMVFLQFSETGNRSNYQRLRSKRRAVLSTLIIGELLEQKGRFIPQIINGIWAICEESTWALPAHLYLQKKYTPLPNPGEETVDLGEAGTTDLMSWTYLLLHQQLDSVSTVIPQRIRYELEKRIIRPYLKRNDFWWMGFQGQNVNNWNPWVNGSVLLTGLLSEKDNKRMVKTVYKTMRSVDHFINQYPRKGGCEEGPSYWSEAGGKLIFYLSLLKRATEGEIDITERPLIENMGRYIYRVNINKNEFVDFSDAHPTLTPNVISVFQFGKACHNDTLKQFASYFVRQGGSPADYFLHTNRRLIDFIRYLGVYKEISTIQPSQPLLKTSWLPDLQMLMVRSRGGTAKGLFLAAKGGNNGVSHNHNDVGNFIIYKDGKPEIIDIGVGTYTRQTFSKNRYKIFTMQSAWHNLPTINGKVQRAGATYKAKEVKIKQGKEITMDIANAYPDSAGVKSWVRTLEFQNDQITLTEKYQLRKYTTPFTLSLITSQQHIQVEKGKVILDNGFYFTFDPRQFSVKIEPKRLSDHTLQRSWGTSLNRILLVDKKKKKSGKYKIVFYK